MKNKIAIAEIGLNHLGSEVLAKKYISYLCKTKIDGISFQIKKKIFYKDYKLAFLKKNKNFYKNFREKKFYLNSFKNKNFKSLELSNKFYKYAIKKCKDNNKLIGFALQDVTKINFFNSQKIDFYKILNEDIANEQLLEKISLNKDVLKFISISNDSIIIINKAIKILKNKKKIILSITDFNKRLDLNKLKKIKEFKKKFHLKVGYGNHSQVSDLKKLFKYNLDVLLFYVKLPDKKIYPDDLYSIKLNSSVDNIYNSFI